MVCWYVGKGPVHPAICGFTVARYDIETPSEIMSSYSLVMASWADGGNDVRGGLWETQDVYGDRQAEAAAKRVVLRSAEKASLPKTSSGLNILRRSNKPYLVSSTHMIILMSTSCLQQLWYNVLHRHLLHVVGLTRIYGVCDFYGRSRCPDAVGVFSWCL